MKKKKMPILIVIFLVTMIPMTVLAAPSVTHCGTSGAGQCISENNYTSTYNHFYGVLNSKTCRVTDYHHVVYYSCFICGSNWNVDQIISSQHSACGA